MQAAYLPSRDEDRVDLWHDSCRSPDLSNKASEPAHSHNQMAKKKATSKDKKSEKKSDKKATAKKTAKKAAKKVVKAAAGKVAAKKSVLAKVARKLSKKAAKKSAKKKATGKVSKKALSPEQRYLALQESAYLLAEKDGFSKSPTHYWLEAERGLPSD